MGFVGGPKCERNRKCGNDEMREKMRNAVEERRDDCMMTKAKSKLKREKREKLRKRI